MLLQVSPPPAQTGLPLWAQVLNLGITLILAGLRTVEFLRRGTLEVRLTRDSFFRLTDFGEALFVHCVLLARNGPVLIQNVSVTLKRLAGVGTTFAEKSFPMEVVNHGEKIKGPANIAEHHFYGASPLLYASGTATFRPVYHCLQAEYRDRQRQAVLNFEKDMRDFKRRKDEDAANGKVRPDSAFWREIEQRIKTHHIKMLGLVELEAGEYELSLEITYEKCGLIVWKKYDTRRSYGYFTVDVEQLETYKNSLFDTLQAHATNIIEGQNKNVIYPEFRPEKFRESTGRRKQRNQ